MKALVGSWDNRPHQLLAEVTALRTRVRELEEALEQTSRERDELRQALEVERATDQSADEREVVLSR